MLKLSGYLAAILALAGFSLLYATTGLQITSLWFWAIGVPAAVALGYVAALVRHARLTDKTISKAK